MACTVNAECFSEKCLNKKCDKSPIGKPCFRDAACTTGLKCISNRCSRGQGQQTPPQTEQQTPANNEDELKLTINNKIQELKNKADNLLKSHESETVNQETSGFKLPTFLTGKFLLQIVGVFKTPEPAAAKPTLNGRTCERNNDCISHICYKVRNADKTGLCGKEQGSPCTANADCLSSRCVARRCAKSGNNGYCQQNSDCTSNSCDLITKRCKAVARVVTPPVVRAPVKKPVVIQAVEDKKEEPADNPFVRVEQAPKPIIGQLVPKPVATPLIRGEQVKQPSTPGVISVPAFVPKKIDGAGCKRSSECRSNLCLCASGKCEAVAIEFTPPAAIAVDSGESKEEKDEAKIPGGAIAVVNPVVGSATVPVINKAALPILPATNRDVGQSCSRNEQCNSESCLCNIGRCVKYTAFSPLSGIQPINKILETSKPTAIAVDSGEEAAVAEPPKEVPFDLVSAQAILDAIFVSLNELKAKVCLEASKHRGIDYGNIKCGVSP